MRAPLIRCAIPQQPRARTESKKTTPAVASTECGTADLISVCNPKPATNGHNQEVK
jgi:hypothetical protein